MCSMVDWVWQSVFKNFKQWMFLLYLGTNTVGRPREIRKIQKGTVKTLCSRFKLAVQLSEWGRPEGHALDAVSWAPYFQKRCKFRRKQIALSYYLWLSSLKGWSPKASSRKFSNT